MATSIRVIPKKRGRPVTTGKGTLIGVRLQSRELAELDHWAARQGDEPSRPEAVRRLIENYQPVLAVHGHIHEAGGERKIGDTLCINPGSEANHGILRGYLVDIGDNGIELVQRVEG